MKNQENAFNIVFFIFGLFPIIPFKLKGVSVAALLIISAYLIVKNKMRKFEFRLFLGFSSLFMINVLSILNTFIYPSRKVETMLSLILIPLAFAFVGRKVLSKHVKTFAFTFIFSCSALSVYHLIYYSSIGLFHEESLRVNSFRLAVTKIPVLADHTIYISMFLGIALLFVMAYFRESTRRIKTLFLVTATIIVVNLFLISSKGIIIAIFLSALFFIFLYLKSLKVKLLIVASSVALFLLSIMYLPTLERRFRELRIASTYNKIQPNNSSSVRIGIYKCVLQTIKEKPILGYGLGTSPQRECYKEASDHLYNYNFNSHNQYFGYMLNAGIFGVLTLLLFLFFHFRYSIKHKDHMYLIMVFFFSIVMLTENILERQSGLILFMFMMSFMFYSRKNILLRKDQ